MSEASRRSLVALLGVRPDERPLVGWLTATFFVIQTTHGLGLNVADTLFFVRFGVDRLPLMILISGGVVMAAMLGYLASLSGFGDRRWLWTVPVLSAGWLLVERVGIAVDIGWIYPVVWQAAQVVMTVTFTLMWTAAAEVCTTRQAKRLYPLFASAGIAGGIVGNAATGPLASALGTENVLVVQAGLLVVGGWLVRSVSREFFDSQSSDARPGPLDDLREGFRLTLRTPLLRLAAVAALAGSTLLFLVVFPFSDAVAGSFESEASVATYLGVFSAAATGATLIVSLFVANRLFARLGVVSTFLLMPLTYLAGFALWAIRFDLMTASIVRGAQWVALNALGATALNSLFNVVRGPRRAQVIAFVNAVPTQVGTSVAGALLLVAGGASDRVRLGISLLVAVGAVIVAVRMRGAYVDALVSAVDRGLVDVFTAAVPGLQKPELDADSRSALGAGLDHPDPARRRVTIAMLTNLADHSTDALLRSKLDDQDPSVRLAALEAIFANGRHTSTAVDLLSDPDRDVRVRAARHLQQTRFTQPSATVDGLLEDPDPELRGIGAALIGGARGATTVSALLAEDDPAAIRSGLEAVAAGATPSGGDPTAFIGHPDAGVRRAAALALADRDDATEALVSLLDDVSPTVRRAAAESLAGRPEGSVHLMRVLREGSVRATEAALATLARSPERESLEPWVDGELDRATLLHHLRAALGHSEDDTSMVARRYLVRVLTARQHRLERWILEALGAAEGMPPLETVSRGAWSEDPETRSQALEALESITHRVQARRLIALIEDEMPEQAPTPREALWELTDDFDPWLRALAIRCLEDELAGEMERLSDLATLDDTGLVGSAAVRTSRSDAPPDGPLGILDTVLALQVVPLFSNLDPEELRLVADVTEERRFTAGDVIYREGATGSDMFVIVDGHAEVRSSGSVAVLRTPGEYVGELAILRNQPRMATIVAGTEGTRGIVVPGDALRTILEEHPEAMLAMLRTLAGRIADASTL